MESIHFIRTHVYMMLLIKNTKSRPSIMRIYIYMVNIATKLCKCLNKNMIIIQKSVKDSKYGHA